MQLPATITINGAGLQFYARLETPQKACSHTAHKRYTMTIFTQNLTSMLVRLLVVLMASLRLAVDTRLTGLPLPFARGDSKPESMLDSELLELRLRVSGSSMAAL